MESVLIELKHDHRYSLKWEELREHCLEHLGEFKTPKVIKIVKDLPKGPSGKIQRLKLRKMETE